MNSDFEIISNKDTITFGDTLTLSFKYSGGDLTTLGMAYSLKYDSDFSNLISSFSQKSNNSWFSSTSNTLEISKQNTLNRTFNYSSVRNDAFSQTGNGNFGELSIIIDEDLLGGITVNSGFIQFQLKDIIHASDLKLDTLGSAYRSIYFMNKRVSINSLDASSFKMYNYNNILTINSEAHQQNLNYKILDVLGRNILSGKIIEFTHTIDINNLKQGIYFVEIKQNNKSLIQKIIKL